MGNLSISFDENNELTISNNSKVTILTSVNIVNTNTELPIEITADFSKIPQNLHGIYYETFIAQYKNSINVYDNVTFKEIKKEVEKSNIDKIVDLICNSLWKKMIIRTKNLLYIVLVILLLSGCQNTEKYCGKVTEKYLLHKNNGGTHNIVFYSDSLNRFISVSVTENTYFNVNVGETVCFNLSDYQVGI